MLALPCRGADLSRPFSTSTLNWFPVCNRFVFSNAVFSFLPLHHNQIASKRIYPIIWVTKNDHFSLKSSRFVMVSLMLPVITCLSGNYAFLHCQKRQTNWCCHFRHNPCFYQYTRCLVNLKRHDCICSLVCCQ